MTIVNIVNEELKKNLEESGFCIYHNDAIETIKILDDNSVKLFYGSPPYPNAQRNYKKWKIEDYIDEITPFIENAIPKLRDDGFIVINVKANRTHTKSKKLSPERSLVIEELMLHMKKNLNLYCVDIEIWIKSNPVPTGVRVACQDAYEYNLWFSKAPKWTLNIDHIRRKYSQSTFIKYLNSTYKPRKNGVQYVTKEKKIMPNENGALPLNILTNQISEMLFNVIPKAIKSDLINYFTNVVYGSVSGKTENHQAVQPEYLPEKYILACTREGDIVLDPWVGSGTTGIVSVKLNRKFIGIDISEVFARLAEENIKKVANLRRE